MTSVSATFMKDLCRVTPVLDEGVDFCNRERTRLAEGHAEGRSELGEGIKKGERVEGKKSG